MKSPFSFPRVQVVPGVDRLSFQVDGVERLGYEFGLETARPFFFPVIGPSGAHLTRMGHPNPVGHEHHKSVWFGHQKINGINFWEERAGTDIKLKHRRVTLIHDGVEFGGMAAEIDWWAKGLKVMRQNLIVALEPLEKDVLAIDIQSRFEANGGPVTFEKTNFGFLGVRMAKTISERFGGGQIRNSEGATGELDIFGKPSTWVDYSGPTRPGVTEGICYMNHFHNPNQPAHWHVRRDGWMEAAFNLDKPFGIAAGHPLELRYRLLVHAGIPDRMTLNLAYRRFSELPHYTIKKKPGDDLPSLVRDSSANA